MEGHVYVAKAPRSTKSALPGASWGRDKTEGYICTIVPSNWLWSTPKKPCFSLVGFSFHPFSRSIFLGASHLNPSGYHVRKPTKTAGSESSLRLGRLPKFHSIGKCHGFGDIGSCLCWPILLWIWRPWNSKTVNHPVSAQGWNWTFADLKKDITPWKTNMTMEYYIILYYYITIFNRRYIFIHGRFSQLVSRSFSVGVAFGADRHQQSRDPRRQCCSGSTGGRAPCIQAPVVCMAAKAFGGWDFLQIQEKDFLPGERLQKECLAENFGSSSDIWKQQKDLFDC